MKRVLAFVLLAATAWGQARDETKKRVLPDIDVRDAIASGDSAANSQQGLARALVERRTREMETFAAARQATLPGARIVPNRHGLPKLFLRDGRALTGASPRDPGEIAKDFLPANAEVFRFSQAEVDQLRLAVKDVTPEATYLAFNQTLNGIDVFEGQIKFTLSKAGEVIQVATGDIAPGLAVSTVPTIRAEDAEVAARAAVRAEMVGTFPRAPELVIFLLDAATARLAYRLFLEVDAEQFYEILIDADNGALLYRHNLYVFAAQGRVWTQSPSVGSRELVTFPDSWLPAGATITTGNNVDAYVDSNADLKPDSTSTGGLQNGHAVSASQVFDFPFGDGSAGMDPRNFKAAAVTNAFYFANIAHDLYYDLGFTEAAGNLQTDNFNKGGTGGDPVLAEAQFGGFTNNSAFAPTPEGTSPRMFLGLFTRGTSSRTDDLDSDYEEQVVIHEYGHGVSNRLVGGGTSTSCLTNIQSGAMGEGWSDYFAISFTGDPVLGAYIAQNASHGFRRQSYEGYTFTYEDVGNSGFEVHDDGEIWAATLWDLRKSLGQAVTDRLVINGLKSTPCNPSMTNARDAILSVDVAMYGGANGTALWTVFARHGLGFSATGIDGTLKTGTVYDAAYNMPPVPPGKGNPAITSKPLLVSASAGEPYSYMVAATNPNAGVLKFTLDSGPAGMTVDSASGTVNWIAGFTSSRVKITITDGKGGKVVHGYLVPVLTRLSQGKPIVIGGLEDTTGYAWIDVPAGVQVLQVTLRGGTGDADVGVVDPDGNFEDTFNDGNNETISFADPKPGRWQVEVRGFADYDAATLTAAFVTPTPLAVNAVVAGLSGVTGSETLYRVQIPAGATVFEISTSGGTGDVDLYLRRDNPALCSYWASTECFYDEFSEENGTEESITVLKPAPGDWYIDLSGFEDYSGVTLTISLQSNAPDLTISKSHVGNFKAGQTGATYFVTVSNIGPTVTSDVVSVTDSLPTGMTATAIAGTGWACTLGTVTCTRSDALAPGADYPAITVTVNVAATAPSILTNMATVSGGGEINTANDSASDLTSIGPVTVGAAPQINIVANAFGDTPLIAPNTWVEIKGSILAPSNSNRIWLGPDFVNNLLPLQLDGVSVKVNGKAAYLYFVSSTQVNILTSPDALAGSVEVQVTNNGVTSNVAIVQAQAQSLSLFEFVSATGKHYVYGRHAADSGLIGPPSLFTGLTTAVKPGESIYVAATGFGTTDVAIVSGSLTQSGNLPKPFPEIKIGGIPATVSFAGLVAVGTYQFNLTVPPGVPDGDLALTGTYNGLSIQPNLLITVQH